ncbi:hypothetical protein BABINDRAFT_163715 [Babjeviella inositovora NRRL Y-12698]|uniref:STAS domain-containing protein n=1 Tax=Babjeviella inositovora NRRL Y-12698 TaxID=984486 RepID=A0A1E3QHU3_9ASCO|nr:uncharacterized protein BABINDRAFT_163715 [Babjeviella inositovora NRRL Y-12698]ODQ77210.1 hypothetical protein BABINDRAFT_163715 [Babjeviella inositovora NRRL Y-12698]
MSEIYSDVHSVDGLHYEDIIELHPEQVVISSYDEPLVGVKDFYEDHFNDPVQKVKDYFISLFPIAKWILHYNRQWLYGDLIAGITVGCVLVPQSMSYAQVAGLEAQYGLYSSFVGVFIYCFFATSKDVSIGPVAVMSLQVSRVISHVQSTDPSIPAPVIATVLSLICGGVAAGIGFLRLGFILEFISMPAVLGFMTGSAFNIITGQVPALMGYGTLVNTRAATYLIVVNTLKNLKHTKLDAVFGLIPLALLYFWRWSTDWAGVRFPKYRRVFFYLNVIRNAIVIVVFTAISFGIVHNHRSAKERPIAVIGTVPSGLKHVGKMVLPDGIVPKMANELPVSIIVLLLEHIAISKSFGRINDYTINPDQEVIAIGVTNLIGTFFNAYPATGSFSRSALKSKCGVRTPFAGIFTGAVVLLALYSFTDAFFYIPKATLSAIIIHAVSDLMSNYQTTWQFWKVAPIDGGIFIIAVILTVFVSIEGGIYFAMCASCAVLLFRIAKPRGEFLGRVRIAEVVDAVIDQPPTEVAASSNESDSVDSIDKQITKIKGKEKGVDASSLLHPHTSINSLPPSVKFHTRWLPFTQRNVNNQLNIIPPPPGVLVFKPLESFSYPNASRQIDAVTRELKSTTRRGKPYSASSAGDRPWNDPAPLDFSWLPFSKFKKKTAEEHLQADYEAALADTRPLLRIIHFDFSAVTQIDATGLQALVDLKKLADRYADRDVEFHFSGILSPWIRRGLVHSGFGSADAVLPSGGHGGADVAKRSDENNSVREHNYFNIGTEYVESRGNAVSDDEALLAYVAVTATSTPFFHLDIPSYENL